MNVANYRTNAAAEKSAIKRKSPISKALRYQAEQILASSYPFMNAIALTARDAESRLFGFKTEPALPMTTWYQPTREEALDDLGPRQPQLMDANEERLMFLRFNYAKLRLGKVQQEVARTGLTAQLAREAVFWHQRFEHFREYLVRTNLALVLAMAKRMRLNEMDQADLVSEGNMALLRSIEKFNVDRGFKFSTYACRAILKSLSRTSLRANKRRTRFGVEFEPGMERSNWNENRRANVEEDCIDELRAIVNRNLAALSPVEETVIRTRFNWEKQSESPLTLEEVGQVIGVTKERVRQIQNHALAKIRLVIEENVLRTHAIG